MPSAGDSFEFRSGRAGWRTATVVKLLFVASWTAYWAYSTTQASGRVGTALSAAVTGLGLLFLLSGVEHPFVEFEMRIVGNGITVTRRSPFRCQQWHAQIETVRVGPIETFNDEPGSSPGYGAHRFIPLTIGAETVRFMDGHVDDRLREVRARLLLHISAGGRPPSVGGATTT
jgi:hypothetical protein